MSHHTLAVDFGTSNSAAAYCMNNICTRVEIEPEQDTLPTAVFFPVDGSGMRIGHAAGEALIAGDEGRYMRALKSILGTPLFHEERPIGGKRRTLAQIVTQFLEVVKAKAEAQAGVTFDAVLSGRPVKFHSADANRDAKAVEDLEECYLAAGFTSVNFLYEPEAAAVASHGLGRAGETGLIVDIGGGTSDFSIYRAGADGLQILASHGIRLGGTNFDKAVSMSHVMPLLGKDGHLRRNFADGLLPVPAGIYNDLSTWAKIPFLYNGETRRAVADLVQHAVDPLPLQRLQSVISDELGHELAFSVERGKIAANSGARGAAIDMGFVERGLSAAITEGTMNAALDKYRQSLQEAIYATLMAAGVMPADIGSVILVGGSSLMKFVSSEVAQLCPAAEIRTSEAFTAVVDGLALASVQKFRFSNG